LRPRRRGFTNITHNITHTPHVTGGETYSPYIPPKRQTSIRGDGSWEMENGDSGNKAPCATVQTIKIRGAIGIRLMKCLLSGNDDDNIHPSVHPSPHPQSGSKKAENSRGPMAITNGQENSDHIFY